MKLKAYIEKNHKGVDRQFSLAFSILPQVVNRWFKQKGELHVLEHYDPETGERVTTLFREVVELKRAEIKKRVIKK